MATSPPKGPVTPATWITTQPFYIVWFIGLLGFMILADYNPRLTYLGLAILGLSAVMLKMSAPKK